MALRFDWRFGTNTSLGIAGDFARRGFDPGDEDLSRVMLDLTYRFSQRFSVTLRAQQTDLSSDDPSATADYEENQVGLYFRLETPR